MVLIFLVTKVCQKGTMFKWVYVFKLSLEMLRHAMVSDKVLWWLDCLYSHPSPRNIAFDIPVKIIFRRFLSKTPLSQKKNLNITWNTQSKRRHSPLDSPQTNSQHNADLRYLEPLVQLERQLFPRYFIRGPSTGPNAAAYPSLATLSYKPLIVLTISSGTSASWLLGVKVELLTLNVETWSWKLSAII